MTGCSFLISPIILRVLIKMHRIENKEVSSAKSFGLDYKPFGKSFMYIKNNKGP